MKVPFLDLKAEYLEIKQEIDSAIQKVLERGSFILGEEVDNFEQEFAAFIGARYAIAVGSGSDALFLALRALGIGVGDEVITAAHTFVSTADATLRCGAVPIFVDIDKRHYCIDPNKIETKITKRTKAIIPVHLYGAPADMDKILNLAQKYNLFVVEDAAQAHGAKYKGRSVGAIGELGCFSFYPTKNLGAYGDAGAIVTDSWDLYDELKKLKNYGSAKKYYHDTLGVNSRLDEIQAAILRVKLKHLEKRNRARRQAAQIYSQLLTDCDLILPSEEDWAEHIYYVYAVAYKKRNEMQKYLSEKGIGTLIHYPVPVHLQKSYEHLGYKEGDLPITEQCAREVLSLPMHPFLKEADIKYIVDNIKLWKA